jgi:hypothetical protein
MAGFSMVIQLIQQLRALLIWDLLELIALAGA